MGRLHNKYLNGFPLILVAISLSCITACTAPTPENQVMSIKDGDTFVVQYQDGTQQTIDLQHADAPEREQPFGREAMQFLKAEVLNKSITVTKDNTVLVNGKNLDLLMLQAGFAWHSPKNSATTATFENQYAYNQAQTDAMNNQAGLWQLAHSLRVPPWVWRNQATERSSNPMQQKMMMEKKYRAMQQQKAIAEQRKSDNQTANNEKKSGEEQ